MCKPLVSNEVRLPPKASITLSTFEGLGVKLGKSKMIPELMSDETFEMLVHLLMNSSQTRSVKNFGTVLAF